MYITGNYTSSSSRYVLCLLLAVGAAKTISTTNAITQKYTFAGDYKSKSKQAWTASLVDLDQKELERLLSLDLDSEGSNWLGKARGVYENGMHSGPYAVLTLDKPPEHPVDLPKTTGSAYINSIAYDERSHPIYELSVVGGNMASDDTMIHGITLSEDPNKTLRNKVLIVSYPEESKCMIDGTLDDCFLGPKGKAVLQGYGDVEYTYQPETDNYFKNSLKGFSEGESMRMYYCEHHGGCSEYLEYENFFKYYGILNYGDHWISSAFSSKITDYVRGNIDFSLISARARNAAISTATVTMNTFTKINQLMIEYAIGGCKKSVKDFSTYGDSSSTDAVIGHWDTAAAIYFGSALISRENHDAVESNSKTGSLYFHLVQGLAEDFGVLEEIGKQSILNRKIIDEFKLGKAGLLQDNCDGQVYTSYWTIVHAMRVPWIQGVLKTAFLLSNQNNAAETFDKTLLEEERGRGAASLAALLPDLHHCSSEAAQTVYDEFEKVLSGGHLDYVIVRDALEHQYQCLSVTCEEVGGYINLETGDYYQATRPCGGYGKMASQRRQSVAYLSGTPSSSSFSFGSHKISSIESSSFFFVALFFFFASVAVLVSVGRHSRRRFSNGYYWINTGNFCNVNDDFESCYEVQLRTMPMSSSTHFQHGNERVGSDSIDSNEEIFVL